MCSKLVAQLLNLRGLLFEGSSEGLNFFLLLCNGRLLPLINRGLFLNLFGAPSQKAPQEKGTRSDGC